MAPQTLPLPPDYEGLASSRLPNGDFDVPKREPAVKEEANSRAQAPCPTCRGLDLSVAQFNIQNGQQAGRPRFAKDGSSAKAAPLFSPRYANSRLLLGSYGEIASRAAGCPFCRLVSKSVDKATLPAAIASSDLDETRCFLTWELDGRSIDEKNHTIKARTRRIHIHWDNRAVPDAFAVFLTPRESSNLVTTDANAVWTFSDHFRARKIKQDASKIALIRSWLEQCLHEHEGSCGDRFEREVDEFERVAKAAHFGVLDIVEMRLTSLPPRSKGKSPVNRKKSSAASSSGSSSDDDVGSDAEGSLFEPYVALSYVWGSKEDQQGFEKLLTNLNNVLTRGFRHAIEEDLKGMPKVIQSSVDLVRRLGYRYLWIDSICIVQDSNRSWRWNSQAMDRIYSNAEFTICAADGSNAKAGLVAFDSPEASSEQVIERCAPGVRLMISRDVESQIASSAWNSRAWTFQERLLSRRCLIFTQGRVFFQCRKATFSEDIVASPQASQVTAWSLDLVRSPLVLLNKLEERPVWFYMHCVELFSGRCLTKATDVLAAFNGVSNLIESAMTGPLCFGLPTSHFDLALLWTPQNALKRRVGGDFPSWSWCGWEGGSASYFSHDFIQDCLENVHQWLISHTWIQWHIRDSQSKLRPLWLTCERVLRNQEARWKGYDSFERAREKMEQNMKKNIDDTQRELKTLKVQKGYRDKTSNGQHFSPDWLSDEASDSNASFSRTPPPEVRAQNVYNSRARRSREERVTERERRTYGDEVIEITRETSPAPDRRVSSSRWHSGPDRYAGGNYDREEDIREACYDRRHFDLHHEDDIQYRTNPPSQIQRPYRERSDFLGPYPPLSPPPPSPPRRHRAPGDFPRHSDNRYDDDFHAPFCSRDREDRNDRRRRLSPVQRRYEEREYFPRPSMQSPPPPPPPPPPRPRRRNAEIFRDRTDGRHDDGARVRFRSRDVEDRDDYRRPPSPPAGELYEEIIDARRRHSSRRRPEAQLDPYGRRVLEGRRGKEPQFRKRAPESPFAVYGAEYSSMFMLEPDSPMLQFWTDSVWLYLIEPGDHDAGADPDGSISSGGDGSGSKGCGPGLRRYGIADAAGDWCGSIILSEQWAREKMHQPRNGGDPAFQFLALSRAKKFTKDECGTWSFYVPLDRQQSEWDLSYVMLVEVQSSVHYRVGVGKVFRHAFRNGAKGKARWEEIVLG